MSGNRLLEFVQRMTRLVEQRPIAEEQLLEQAAPLMRELVSHDDWLPGTMAVPDTRYYQQHLLYGDPLDRFSLVSFVWGPGQKTPIHDHTVWGIIAMLRGAECARRFSRDSRGALVADANEEQLAPGDLDLVSPSIGDIHQVRNAFDDRVSISIHLYGGNIGRIERHAYSPDTGVAKPFVSGYSNTLVPNLWARNEA
ncbi:cysteine dioxygenase [Comamonadaceae bacterium G21597-S1]|nr:cysteine dioxygenase [Comamonadaceae bacterium G21597-S1]